MTRETKREEILRALGASAAEIEELIAYGANAYDWSTLPPLDFPWADEPCVPVWEAYAKECNLAGSIAPLAKYIVQLQFPVCEGMSQNEDYHAATRRAVETSGLKSATGLRLRSPERCRILIHPTSAGRIPILVAGEREDFIALVQALTERNEPAAAPDSMGACMVSGYNNLHRIRMLREEWKKRNPRAAEAGGWNEEFSRILAQPALFRDRFILVSDGPYSNTSARDMGMPEETWRALSLQIRIEHECTHYFVRRAFPSTRFQKNMQEELTADYAGIKAASGSFHADWLLRFIGLEDYPHYRQGGRLENYRGLSAISDGAFVVLQRLMKQAAENVERYDRLHARAEDRNRERPFELLALSYVSVEEIASSRGPQLIEDRVREFQLSRNHNYRTPPEADPIPAAREEKS